MTLHQKHRYRLFLIIVATAFYFIANIQRTAIPGAAFNILQNDFMATASKITMLGAIFSYVYAVTQLIVGLLVDKIGGFRVIALGCIAFTIGAILFPYSHSVWGLYLSRALLGFGAATFYLSIVREVKKYSQDKNFSLAVSYILFIGYSGGIVANAPFVALVEQTGWRYTMCALGYITLFLTIVYILTLVIFRPTHIEVETKFSLEPFREVLCKKENINLYIFGSINYGLCYVLQCVIGNKFLQDFCFMSLNESAIVLSTMALVSALAGTITAFISRCINNRRAIIFKIFAFLSLFSALSVCLLLALDIHTKIVALIFCIPSFIGSISPLLILTLHVYNRYEVSATAVSIQNCAFFMMVGILGMVSGILMNVFAPLIEDEVMIYSNNSYLLVFGLFLILSIIQVICAMKIKD